MRLLRLLPLAALALGACAARKPSMPVASAAPPPALAYPATRTVDAVDVIHGRRVADPYRWLEEERSPEVQAWMKAEDGLARDFLSRLPGRKALAARTRELLYVESMGVPVRRGPMLFFTRRRADQEKAVVWVRDVGGDRPLLDPNGWSKDGSVALGGWSVSWDGRTIAYQVKAHNSDDATLRVMDVETGRESPVDVIEGGRYARASFTVRGDGFYYTWLPTDPSIPEPDRPGRAEIRFHRLGTDPRQDPVVRPPTGDPAVFQEASLSRDGHWLLVHVSHGWSSTDVWYRDARKEPAGPFLPLVVGSKAHYAVEAYRDRFYVHTDEGAPRWRLLRADPERPARAEWKELVPEGQGTLESATVVGGRLALAWLEWAQTRLELRELDGRRIGDVNLPALGTASLPSGEQDGEEAYFSFESFTWPREIRSLAVATGATKLLFRPRVPVDAGRWEVEQVEVPSRDGTRVTMFLVHAPGAKHDGSHPVLLGGYGGFDVSEVPVFSPTLFPWLERGGVYALPNLRGGGEYGERWHEEGMLLKKQNVFDDFLAAAGWLVAQKWTRPSRLVIRGGSNGGLLVGAAMTQRPDLFAAVLCGVPLLDMIRYPLFGAGRTWTSEYGTADDPAQFQALIGYSPYHHVEAGTRYPALLLLSADHDDRVDPMHARKFAAEVQAATTGGPVLLRIERNAGHTGADMLRARVEQTADEYAFAFAAMGITP